MDLVRESESESRLNGNVISQLGKIELVSPEFEGGRGSVENHLGLALSALAV